MGRLTNTKKGNIMVTMQIILKTSIRKASVRDLICYLKNGASFKAMHIEPLPLAMVGETGWLKNLLQS